MAASVGLRREGALCLGCELGPRHACTCGFVDDRGHQVLRIEDHLDEPDEFWYAHKRQKKIRGALVWVADTIGTGVRGWGKGYGIPLAKAKMRSMAMALSRVDPSQLWIWNDPRLAECRTRALLLRGDEHVIEEHGCSMRHAKNVSIEYRVGGGVVEVHWKPSDGVRVCRVVVKVKSNDLDDLYEDEACGEELPGVAAATSRLAGRVLKKPESCLEQLLEVWQKHRDAELLAAEAARDDHQRDLDRMLKGKLDFIRDECAKRGWNPEVDGDIFANEDMRARHFCSPQFPKRVQDKVMGIWYASESADRFGKDAQLKAMREGLDYEDKREIVLASLPHLRNSANGRYRAVVDWLVTQVQIDHICSLAIDNPINLILDWSAPNGHHGSLRNCEGKAARYGPEVMDAVTKWLAAAVRAAYGVIESA